MVIIPREKPVVQGLNSYYLNINRLLEHFQGELGSGAVHFKSSSVEGVVFFDKDDFLSGVYKEGQDESEGKEAIHRIIEKAGANNFTVNIFEIDPSRIYFWANMPAARKLYEDLSTEFTDLEGLIKKMSSQHLTGYIDVSIGDGKAGGLIFLNEGQIIGGSYSWSEGELNRTEEAQTRLIDMSKESGGVFHVMEIIQEKAKEDAAASKPAEGKEGVSEAVDLVQELLNIFERTVKADKGVKTDFRTLLKTKFVEKADDFAFLDPFADEFNYSNQRVSVSPGVEGNDLLEGVVKSVREIAEEQGILERFKKELGPWSRKHSDRLGTLNIEI